MYHLNKHIRTYSYAFLTLLFTFHALPIQLFGNDDDIIEEALKMTTYEHDATAQAVIISDVGTSYFGFDHPRFGLELIFERTLIIKILDEDGYDWADFEIPLYKTEEYEEELRNIKCFTYNLVDGKTDKTKLSKKSVFEEDVNEHWNEIRITMPDVRVGSVMKISYQVSSPFIFNLQSWSFQNEIPTKYSEYTTTVPEYFTYNANVIGYYPLTNHETSSGLGNIGGTVSNSRASYHGGPAQTQTTSSVNYVEKVDKWTAVEVPAFKREPYTTDPDNFKTAVRFELAHTDLPNSNRVNYTSTWEDINRNLMENDAFGKFLNKSSSLKGLLSEVLSEVNDDQEKIQRIYNYVKNNIRWNDEASLFASDNPKSIVKNGAGNSADINLLLTSMFLEAGLMAAPIAISTRSHGIVFPTQPTISSFNYVLTGLQINEDEYLILDATEPSAPPGILPYRCLNGSGRLITDSGSTWIGISSKAEKARNMLECSFKLDEEKIVIQQKSMYYDQAALDFRNNIGSQDDFEKELEDGYAGLVVTESTLEKLADLSSPPTIECELNLEDHYTSSGEMIYFKPLFYEALQENPFKLEERAYPVDYGVQIDDMDFIKINIPEGYAVESLPEKINMVLPNRDAEYLYDVQSVGNQITLRSHFKINKPVFNAEQYADLKNFYDVVVSKQEEQIILKRK